MRLAILTYESLFANRMTRRLLQADVGQVVGIVRSTCLIHGRSLWGSVGHILRRGGPEFFVLKALDTMEYRLAVLWLKLIGQPRRVPTLAKLAVTHHIPLHDSPDVNAPPTMAVIRDWQPDLVASVYLNQRIGPDLIGLGRLGCINVHPALLPRYRGLFPYFWVLANGETVTGVTVHVVEPAFDTGPIIAQHKLDITPQDTAQSLQYKSARLGAELLVEAVRRIEAGDRGRPQNGTQASYYSWPGSADFRRFRQQGRRFGTWRELLSYV